MSITTKKGDKGKTSLCWGGRVSKDNLRIEAAGTLDELCSYLGMARSLIRNKKIKKLIESVQKDLFVICAQATTELRFVNKLGKRINNNDINRLEKFLNELERKKKIKERCFYLPGENLISSTLDIARTVARRAERKIVTLKRKKIFKNNNILTYLNRLSDLLYLLARSYEKKPQRVK